MNNRIRGTAALLGFILIACGGPLEEQPAPTGTDAPETSVHATSLPNFRVGIQVADNKYYDPGEPTYTGEAHGSPAPTYSDWAWDPDHFDPDSVRLHLELSGTTWDFSKDFQIGIAVMEGDQVEFPVQWSGWASEGGAFSPWAKDRDGFDPDAFRIVLNTRDWPNTKPRIRDFRLGIKLVDRVCSWFSCRDEAGSVAYTNLAKSGGGWSPWAMDRDGFDPDGASVGIQILY